MCGDGEGCLVLFNWGLWGDITDRFPGHPQSVDSLLTTSDSVVCSGCMDGTIRWGTLINSICTRVNNEVEAKQRQTTQLHPGQPFISKSCPNIDC